MRDLPTITRDGEHLYLDGEEVSAGKAAVWVDTLRREAYEAELRREWRMERNETAAKIEAQRAKIEARGGTHIVVSDCIRWRENGRPMVWAFRSGECVASELAHVGPGPTLEFVVHGGRKWRPLSELKSYMTVREWREVGDAG